MIYFQTISDSADFVAACLVSLNPGFLTVTKEPVAVLMCYFHFQIISMKVLMLLLPALSDEALALTSK